MFYYKDYLLDDLEIGDYDSPVKMWAGDISIQGVQDGAINIADIMEVTKSFNSSEGDGIYNANCDLNGDKTVNISDIMIVVANFNKTSMDYTK